MPSAWLARLELNGFAVIPDVLPPAEVERLRAATSVASNDGHALRGLLELDWVRDLARTEAVHSLMEAALGKGCFAVRGIFFDKIPGANWLVPPHQDLSIALAEQRETDDFGPWSRKEGVVHVQPPREILERMATIRLHLDNCDQTNGALRVVPASHRNGKLDGDSIADATKGGETVVPRTRRRCNDFLSLAHPRLLPRPFPLAPPRRPSGIRRLRTTKRPPMALENLKFNLIGQGAQ